MRTVIAALAQKLETAAPATFGVEVTLGMGVPGGLLVRGLKLDLNSLVVIAVGAGVGWDGIQAFGALRSQPISIRNNTAVVHLGLSAGWSAGHYATGLREPRYRYWSLAHRANTEVCASIQPTGWSWYFRPCTGLAMNANPGASICSLRLVTGCPHPLWALSLSWNKSHGGYPLGCQASDVGAAVALLQTAEARNCTENTPKSGKQVRKQTSINPHHSSTCG